MTRPWQTALTGAPRSVATSTPSQCTPPARASPKRATTRPLTGQASLPRSRVKTSFPSIGKRSTAARGALGALAAHLGERRAHLADRELGALELGGELVALDLLGAHLSGDPLDLGLDRLQLRFRLPGIGLRAPGGGSRGGAHPDDQRQGTGEEQYPARRPRPTLSARPRSRQADPAGRAPRDGDAIMRGLFRPRHA